MESETVSLPATWKFYSTDQFYKHICQVSWQLPFFNLNVLERDFNSDLVNYIYIGGTGVLEIKSVTDGAAAQFLLMSTL